MIKPVWIGRSFLSLLVCSVLGSISISALAASPEAPVICETSDCSGGVGNGGGSGGAAYSIRGAIPAGWEQLINWPLEPRTNASVTVSNSSQLAAALSSGTNIILNNGDYGSLTITSAVNDVHLSAANPGGARFSFLGVHGDRIRISGVRVNGQIRLADQLGSATGFPTHVLLDDVHVTYGSGTTPTVLYGEGAHHIAFVNSTIINTDDAWPILYSGVGAGVSTDFILANCYVRATTGQANNDAMRLGHTSRIILVDNWIQSAPTSANQTRTHAEIEDILLSNNVFVDGAAKLFIDRDGSGVPGVYARRLFAIDNRMYDQTVHSGGDGPFSAMSNQGAITGASATGNRHYSGAQSSGSSTMTPGPTPWVTYNNNVRVPYQSLPSRTQGARH